MPLSDALATTVARRSKSGEGRRFDYGWLRASGSAASGGLASAVWFSVTLLCIGGAADLLFPKRSRPFLANLLLDQDNPRKMLKQFAGRM